VFLDDGFKCSGEVRMLNARIDGDFGCNGAQFTSTQAALSLDKVVIHGNASLTGGFVSSGLIRFSGAHIYGDVDFKGAVLTASVEALNLNTTAIDGHIYLREGFESAGLVSLQYSRIGNTVDCGGGKFSCPTTSLRLEAMSARHVYLSHGFSAVGLVELQSADINGDLNCDQCCMPALYCPNARIGGELIWTSVQKPGQTKLCLNKTTVGTIKDDRQSWPSAGSLSLDGLSYGDLILHESITDEQRKRNSFGTERGFRVADRIAWLNLQSPEALITPQPWIHLADFLKARGEAASAKRVVFELKRHQANAKNSMLRWGMIWLSWLEEQPLRIFWSVVLLTLMGSILFWHAEREGAMAPTNEAAFVSWARGTPYKFAYPRFNPAMYSLENTLPLVKLGQDAAWAPKAMQHSPGWLTSYGFLAAARWFLILAGWVQATALASAIGGRFKP
jgi:hypothetical protein